MENRILLTNNSGNALLLDGVNDYAQAPYSPSLNLAVSDNTFTIEGSFYVRTLSDNSNRRLLTKSQEYDVGIVFSESSADFMYFAVYNALTLQRVTFGGNTNLAVGWHHFAATAAESTGSFPYELNIFLDGTRLATRVNAPVINAIGTALVVGGVGGGAGAYNGFIDEVRLSDSVRYSGAAYTVPSSPFVTDANTRALWHFDEAVGSTTFFDSSANGNTLTGFNGAQTFNTAFHNSPVFTSLTTANVPETTTAVMTVTATDADLPPQTVTFSIIGGADQSKFGITAGGVLTFNSAPDFESPTDANVDNVYVVTVQVSDGSGLTDMQTINVTVTPVNDYSPVFTSPTTANVPENTTAVVNVTTTDADLPPQTVTFSIFGGADQSKFGITPDGVLTFNSAPDFEAPTDADGNKVYEVIVQADDGNGLTATQTINVLVTNVNELPLLLGDYNDNGTVDAADYTVWRNTLGATVTPYSGADGSGDGIIDSNDYGVWKSNFGNTLPVGVGSTAIGATATSAPLADEQVALAEPDSPAAQALAEPVTAARQRLNSPAGLVSQSVVSRSDSPRFAGRDLPAVVVPHDNAIVAWLAAKSAGPRRELAAADLTDLRSEGDSPDSPSQLENVLDLAFESLAI